MKKKHIFLSLMACLLSSSALFAIEKDENGTYLISSGQELVEFSTIVNEGSYEADAILTADIDMTGLTFTPIGTSDLPYSGTFDGQGHTIDKLVFPSTNRDDGQGIFGYINNATIQNLIAGASNRIYGGAFVGGLVGDKVGSGTAQILYCGHEGRVNGANQNAAAFVGCVHSGNLVISYCYNTGRVTGGRESAIFCGWFGGSQSAISDCYNSGTLSSGVEGSYYLWRASPTSARIYDLGGRQQSTRFSLAQRGNGGLAWMLNGNMPDGVWHQNLDNGETPDDHPYPLDTHGKVYASDTLYCDGTAAGPTARYSNSNNAVYLPHRFEDGLCQICLLVDSTYMYTNKEGYYEIATPAELRWIASYINTHPACTDASIRIMNNLDMKDVPYDGIGSMDVPFAGEIDGNGCVISNLTMRRPGDTGVGLVNVGTHNLEIHDLTLDQTCVITGYRYVGGFLGRVTGADGNRVFLRNLGFEGTVNVNDNGGGIVGCIPNNNITGYFYNCYSMGTINGVFDNGAISGWSAGARLYNCYAKLKGRGWENGHDVVRGGSVHFINCYAQGSGQASNSLYSFTDAEMRDGTLLRNLSDVSFHQVVGTDDHPVVYQLKGEASEDNNMTEDTSGIQNAQSDRARTPKIYNLQGIIVGSQYKGIIVRDGKKYLMK